MLRARTLGALLVCGATGLASAAEQWEWTSDLRTLYSDAVLVTDPQTYSSQTAAAAALRSLAADSGQLSIPSSAQGNALSGTVEINYFAPLEPLVIENRRYNLGIAPSFNPEQRPNPISVMSEGELAQAINQWHQENGNPACASLDYGIELEAMWAGPGGYVADKGYTYDQWLANNGSCYTLPSGKVFSKVFRIQDQICPEFYTAINTVDPNIIGDCEYQRKGVITGTPHQCEVTPISTSVGNPCDTVTGAKTETEIDYSSDTVQLVRSYNSHAQSQISFGSGWMHNYDRKMSIRNDAFGNPDHPTMLIRPNGVANLLRLFNHFSGTYWQSTSGNGLHVRRDGTNFRAYLDSGATELYNSKGFLIELVDPAGTKTTVSRDSEGLVTLVTGPFGKTLTFHYDSESQLISIDDPAGNPILYSYGSNGELETVTYQDSTVRQYHYEDPNFPFHLTGITDENTDRFSTYGYDAIGRSVLTTHSGGTEQFTLEYEPTQTIVKDAAGTEQIFQFTTDQTKLRKLTGLIEQDVATAIISPEFFVDIQRRPTQIVDARGIITEFAYDNFHLLRKTEAKGTPEERTIEYQYLSNNSDLVTVETRSSVAPGAEMVTVTDYGTDNLPDTVTISGFTASGDAVQRTVSTQYNSQGKPISIDGPRTDVSDVTTFEYYECITGAECGQLKSTTNAGGHVTTFDSYDDHGRIEQITDPNGLITIITYDLRGRVQTAVERSLLGVERTTTFSYDDIGQIISTALPNGLTVSSTYNAAHLLTRMEDNLGNHITYQYDLRGNRTDEDTFDANGFLSRAVDITFDIRNRIETINAGGFVTTLMADALGNLREQVDPELATTVHEYDGLNRSFRTTDAELGLMTTSYDVHDNAVQVVTPNGAATIFEYDDLRNMLQELSPDRGTTIYTFDDAGNRATELDARGMLTTYSYDALNRLTLVSLNGGGTIAYEYDVGTNAIGRLNKITDSTGQTSWTYDNFGAVTEKRQTIGAVGLTTAYTYDSGGRMATMTMPSGKIVTYGYNSYQQNSISVDGQTILSGATYDPFGPVHGWTWGNGTVANREFDLRGLATSIDFNGDTQTLGYDSAGQLSSQLDSNVDLSFGYDLLGRLTDYTNNNAAGGGGNGPLFSAPPVLLASIQTMNNEIGAIPSEPSAPWMNVAVKNVTATSAKLSLERGQVNTGSIDVKEKIGYLAIEERSGGSFLDSLGNTITYEAQISPTTIQGWGTGCFETGFQNIYASNPVVMASLNSHNGGDGGWLRRCSLKKTALGLTVDEDKFGDGERKHNNAESAGIVAFSSDFDALFTEGNGSWGMEIAKITLPSTATTPVFSSITFRQAYATKPIVIVLPNKSGSNPASVRIRNVSKTGFEVVQVEPAPENGTHNSMPIHYLAIESGMHELPDGTKLEAGRESTKKQQHGSGVVGSEGWATVNFSGTESSIGAQMFTFDANGNRTSLVEDGTTYLYSNLPNSNRLLSAAGPIAKTYSHDAAGNVLGDGVHAYAYDDRGRLVDVDSGSATYRHNGQGQRVVKVSDSETLFLYDEAGGLIGEYDETGAPIQETVWFNDAPVAVLEGASHYYVHTDHLGTPRVITDGDTVVWRWKSDPFGTTHADQDPDGDSDEFTYNHRFRGQYFDDETGLHYNYFRTYDPQIGKYYESDPIGLEGGLNTVGYVGQSPTNLVDPFGLAELSDDFRGGKNAIATVVCRRGEFAVELIKSDPCIDDCVRRHEQVHITMLKATNGSLCQGVEFAYIRETNVRRLEAQEQSGYLEELKCLEESEFLTCYTDECAEKRSVRIGSIKAELGFF